MDLSQSPDRASAGCPAHSNGDLPQIPRRWLALAWAAWGVVAAAAVALFVASLPAYYDQLRTACTGSACISHQLTPEGVLSLRKLGLSVDFYAAYSVALAVLFTGACLAIAAVIFWRVPGERMALLGALMLVLFGIVFPETPRALAITYPLWYWPISGRAFLGFVSAILFINLFPGGRFVPRWTRWAALVWIVAAGQGIFFPDSTERPWISVFNTYGVCVRGRRQSRRACLPVSARGGPDPAPAGQVSSLRCHDGDRRDRRGGLARCRLSGSRTTRLVRHAGRPFGLNLPASPHTAVHRRRDPALSTVRHRSHRQPHPGLRWFDRVRRRPLRSGGRSIRRALAGAR